MFRKDFFHYVDDGDEKMKQSKSHLNDVLFQRQRNFTPYTGAAMDIR